MGARGSGPRQRHPRDGQHDNHCGTEAQLTGEVGGVERPGGAGYPRAAEGVAGFGSETGFLAFPGVVRGPGFLGHSHGAFSPFLGTL